MSDELARRAVACRAWKWMPGMRYVAPSGYYYRVDDVAHAAGVEISDECAPDLADRATLGCLLHLVREHWGDDGACLRRGFRSNGTERWTCEWMCHTPSVTYPLMQTIGATEAEALVKALEMEIPND